MGEDDELLPGVLLEHKELWEILLREEVTGFLSDLFGKRFTYYPNLTVRRDVFVPWHIDDAFVGPGRSAVWEPDFLHLQGAIYLQPNAPGEGGAIDVVPGSHMKPVDGGGHALPDYSDASSTSVTIEANAGDLILWHARTVHRSTPREGDSTGSKYGIFFSAGRRDLFYNNLFLTHLASKRILRGSGRTVQFKRHIATAELKYPDHFPAALRDGLEDLGGRFTTLFPWPPEASE